MVRKGAFVWVVALTVACGSSESGDGDGDSPGGNGGSSGAAGSTPRGGSAGGGGTSTGGTSTGGAGGAGGAGGSTAGAAGAGAAPGMCPGTTNHTAGTRLRPRFIVTEDGVRNWESWHDSMLDVRCSFQQASDGVTRCLPTLWSGSTELFLDAACTDPVYTPNQVAPCTASPYIMTFVSSGGCDGVSGYEVFEIGAAVSATTLYSSASGTCSPTTVAAATTLYRKGAAVPPSTFVSATSAIEPGVGRIAKTAYTAADGTHQVMGWVDRMLETSCNFNLATDGELRCLPSGFAMFQTFSDPGCTSRALSYAPGCAGGEPPPYAALGPYTECPNDGNQVQALGDTFPGPLYSGSPASCGALTPQPGETFYRTSAVPPETFPAAEYRVDESAPGRLKPRYYTSADGGCWFQGFYDSELDVACSLMLVADGRYRCLPGAYRTTIRAFRDAGCTDPVLVTPVGANCTPVQSPTHILSYSALECGNAWTTAEAGPTVPAAGLYQNPGAACVPLTVASEFVTLTPLPVEQFVAGEPRVE